jgi:hypothetical protein
MSWNAELAYFVTPKSGPMRPMVTLRDANHALLDDLPARCRHQRHWFRVGRLLMGAVAEGSSRLDLMLATDALVMALEIEGWMTWQPRLSRADDQKSAALLPQSDTDQFKMPLAMAA